MTVSRIPVFRLFFLEHRNQMGYNICEMRWIALKQNLYGPRYDGPFRK